MYKLLCINILLFAILLVGCSSPSTASLSSTSTSIPPTFTPSSTPSPLPSHTSTSTLTPTPTNTPTPTITNTPTLTSVPTSAILYFEDFEDQKADHWSGSYGKWTIEVEDDNHYWAGTGPEGYPQAGMTFNTNEWTDYAFESRIRIVKGAVHILARWNNGNFYAAFLNPAGNEVRFAEWDRKEYIAFGGNEYHVPINKWVDVRFELQGDNLSIYIDNELADSTKRTSYYNGGIAYYMGGGEEIHFDDIRVWELGSP